MDPVQDQNETPEQASVPGAPSTPSVAPLPSDLNPTKLAEWRQQVLEEARKTAQSWADKALKQDRERIQKLLTQADEPFNDPILGPMLESDKEALQERRRASFIAKALAEQPPASPEPEQSGVSPEQARAQLEMWAAGELRAAGIEPNDPEWNLLHPGGYNSQADWTRAKDAAAQLVAARKHSQPSANPPSPVPAPAQSTAAPAPAAPYHPPIVDVTGGKGVAPDLSLDALDQRFRDALDRGDMKEAQEAATAIRKMASGGG